MKTPASRLFQLYPIMTHLLFQSYLVAAMLLGITLTLIAPKTHAEEVAANLIQVIDTSVFPSPDPSGIIYVPSEEAFWITDSEINEMDIFQGFNVFKVDLSSGVLSDTFSTLSPILFSEEPTGITINPVNNHCFISDDDKHAVFEIDPGPDGLCLTTDDKSNSVTEINLASYLEYIDAEDVTYGLNSLFIAGGSGAQVHRIMPGPNGVFDSLLAGDDLVNSFDTLGLGIPDPEGIVFDSRDNTLYIVGSTTDNLIFHTTTEGVLLRTIDISIATPRNPSGLTLAPSSVNPSMTNLYMTVRGFDNNSYPDENDGAIYEFEIPLYSGNLPPLVSAGEAQSITLTGGALLNGEISDDGLPNGILASTWSKYSGPGNVSFTTPESLYATASFSMAGSYVLRLTADDGELANVDYVFIEVNNGDDAISVINNRVSVNTDDAEEFPDGNMSLKSSDLEMAVDKGFFNSVGIRFTNLSIPKNALISNAYIQFKADEKDSESVLLTIHGENTANAPGFNSLNYNISDRTKTSASVIWAPAIWDTVGESGENQRTPDLSSIVQEIVSTPEWQSDNAIAFILNGTGTRVAEAYDGDQAGAPLLHLEYIIDPSIIAPVITLIGGNPVNLNIGDTFTDPGATAMDNVDGDISAFIQFDSDVDTSVAATYLVTYTVTDSDGNSAYAGRSVIVNDSNSWPVVTLIGDNPINLNVGDTFIDPGATAIDNEDGDISASIQLDSDIDTAVAGTYMVTYTVTDSDGNTSYAGRIVSVTGSNIPPVVSLIGDNPISLNIGDTFTDPGAIAIDYEDGDISAFIQTYSDVDTAVAATYTITYTVTDSDGNTVSTSRSVIVNGINSIPLITLVGSNLINLNIGDTFTDPGATAIDNEDGDISSTIQTDSDVDTAVAATYLVSYTVTDSDGNRVSTIRSVFVSDSTSPSTIRNVPSDYATIQDAITNAVDGDTIILAPGTYQVDTIQYIDKNNITIASRFLTSGDKDDIDTTIIIGNPLLNLFEGVKGQSANLKLIGLTITDARQGVSFYDNYGEVHYCNISNTGTDAIGFESLAGGAVTHTRIVNAGDDAIDIDTISEGSFLFAYNEFINPNNDSIEIHLWDRDSVLNMHHDIHDNLFSGADNDGIQLIDFAGDTKRTFDIYRNIFAGSGDAAIGSMFEETSENFEGTAMTERVRIYNNYFYDNNHHITGGDNMIILNNIFEEAAVTAVKRAKVNSITDYNIFYNNPIDTEDTLIGSNNIYSNPLRNNDFTLQAGSPAIDAGTSSYVHLSELVLQILSTEYTGQNPDMGVYEHSLNTLFPVITLIGDNPMSLNIGDTFTDPGATAIDNEDGDISASILTNSDVDTSVAATYTVTYTVTDSDANTVSTSRSVIVNGSNNAPLITLLGDNPLALNIGDTFTDPGATAIDNEDGDISASILTNSDVDTSVAATYTVTYTVTDSDGNTAFISRSVVVNVVNGGNYVLQSRISTNVDDAEEFYDGNMSLNSTDLELGLEKSLPHKVGVRFTNLSIPENAVINKAYIQFKADEKDSESTALTIYGESIGNAPAFNNLDYNISDRTKTNISVSWLPAVWGSTGAAGEEQRTPDLSSLIQEIISTTGWESNNAIAFIISGDGARVAEAYEGDPDGAALLYIEFSVTN